MNDPYARSERQVSAKLLVGDEDDAMTLEQANDNGLLAPRLYDDVRAFASIHPLNRIFVVVSDCGTEEGNEQEPVRRQDHR